MVHLTLLLLVLCAGVTASSVVDLQKRIIGGQQCGQHERLYHVRLLAIAPNGACNFCGGSLISNQWILTAAHCWLPGERMYAAFGVHPGPPPGQQGRPLVEITVRHIFTDRDQGNNIRSHDIMLLKLPTRETQIQPIALPNCGNKPRIGQNVQIAGHAATTHNPNYTRRPAESPTLQCAYIAVSGILQFTRVQINFRPYVLYQHAFTGQNPRGAPRVDVCRGDSGGGVVFNDMIYGVISSAGVLACHIPVTFMDVCHQEYNNWIAATIRPKKTCLNCLKPF